MKLLIVASPTIYENALKVLDHALWRVVLPSLYSDLWSSSGADAHKSIIMKYLPRFEEIYIEEGLRLETITLLQHAIEDLSIKEYFLCDFESIDDIKLSIDNSYFVDKNHANAKYAEYKINQMFSTKISKAIKAYAIEKRSTLYKQNSRNVDYSELNKQSRAWHKQLQNFFVLLPTLSGLYWIVKAERHIMEFDPRKIHRIYIQYKKDQVEFTIPYDRVYTDELIQERNDAVEYFKNPANTHRVNFYQTETKDVKPTYKPVVLSFLQSKMFYLYHFSIEYTTKIAKRLHQSGLITEPATSSYYVPAGVSIAIIRMLNEKYGEEYVLQSQREFKSADEGMTAILPIHFEAEYFPENVENTPEFKRINFESTRMRSDAVKVYELIYAITEWLQMKDAIYDSSILQIKVGNNRILEAKANSLVEVYDPEQMKEVPQTCWKNKHQALLNALATGSGEPQEEDRPVVLPRCSFGEVLTPAGVNYAVSSPKRPPRYGVGRFNVQILGAKGIGTAESFHIIQNNLVSSGLVVLANTMMNPQQIALETIEWCEKFCPGLLDESLIHEYWDRLGKIRFEGEKPEQLIGEYDYIVNEILEHAGYVDNNASISEGQIKLAKAIVIQKNIRIDNPDEFFSNHEKVKQLLSIYSIDDLKEETKLFKCPICRQGYVYQKDFINTDSKEISVYFACEHQNCFKIFDNKIDEFFIAKKKDFNADERIEALKNIASKQHLKNNGYLFTGFIGKNEKPYDAKVIIDTYLDNKKVKRYGLKVVF